MGVEVAVCPVDKRRDDECRVAGCLGTTTQCQEKKDSSSVPSTAVTTGSLLDLLPSSGKLAHATDILHLAPPKCLLIGWQDSSPPNLAS